MLFLFRVSLLTAAAQFLIKDDGPQKADCILVLGGDGFGNRITRAAQLVQAGYAPFAYIDGPVELIGHESDMTIRYAVQSGYPEHIFKPIWLPKGMDSTRDEVKYVVESVLRPNHVKKILLVTSNYHTRRAGRFLRAAAPDIAVIVTGAPDTYFTPNGWWKDRNARKIFLYEWLKTVSEWWEA
jgi:uncharacterized SAM-binding protein YcdF (DUF218 family)